MEKQQKILTKLKVHSLKRETKAMNLWLDLPRKNRFQ